MPFEGGTIGKHPICRVLIRDTAGKATAWRPSQNENKEEKVVG